MTLLREEQKRDSTMAFSLSMDGQLVVVVPRVYLDNSRPVDGQCLMLLVYHPLPDSVVYF